MNRLRWLGLVGLLVAGVLVVVSASQPWAAVAGREFTGRETTSGLVPALGWLTVLLVPLLLMVGRTGRRVLAVLAAGIGLAQVLVGLLRRQPPAHLMGGHEVTATLEWPWLLAVAGGAVALASAVATWWAAPHWPVRTDRFDRTPTTDADLWKAMDAGVDPTASD